MLTLERTPKGWAVLIDGELIGHVIGLTRGQGWRAGLGKEWATGRYRTRLLAADALAERHRSALASTT